MLKHNLDKASWEMIEFLKETTKKNLILAVKSNQLKIDEEVLPKLFSLLDSSISEGYNKSYKNFSTKFEKISESISTKTTDEPSLKKTK